MHIPTMILKKNWTPLSEIAIVLIGLSTKLTPKIVIIVTYTNIYTTRAKVIPPFSPSL